MNHPTTLDQIRSTEEEIGRLIGRLGELRRSLPPVEIPDYPLQTLEGPVTLSQLFAGRDKLFVIHNMGQGCRYCTLWADGIDAFLPHLEDQFAVVLVSKDDPETQRRLANQRGWRFRMASHGGQGYILEQSLLPGESNLPGMVCYTKKEGKILRLNSCIFGPGDLYCSFWHILALAGLGLDEWTPQYSYWKRPAAMDDGGDNLRD